MKKIVLIIVLAAASLTLAYFLSQAQPNENKFEQLVLPQESYAAAAGQIAQQINELSPTPPTAPSWMVTGVEFVKNEPYAYATYHDTHNIFRLLLQTGQENRFQTIATFEPAEAGWKLKHGQDLAKGRETAKITINNQ